MSVALKREVGLIWQVVRARWLAVSVTAIALVLLADSLTFWAPALIYLLCASVLSFSLAAILAGRSASGAERGRAIQAGAFVISVFSVFLLLVQQSLPKEKVQGGVLAAYVQPLRDTQLAIIQKADLAKRDSILLVLRQKDKNWISAIRQQPFRQAIEAAVRGAREGDNLMVKAVSSLQLGDVAAAADLFKQRAELVAAGNDNRLSADAYFDFANMVILTDRERAVAAYHEAAKLDPENLPAQTWSSCFLRKDDSEIAQNRLQNLLTLNGLTDYYRILANNCLAQLYRWNKRDNLGEFSHLEQAHFIVKAQLLKGEVVDIFNLEDAYLYYNIGDWYSRNNKYDESVTFLNESIKILEKFSRENPDDVGIQVFLTEVKVSLGKIFLSKEKYSEAMDLYYKTLSDVEEKIKESPDELAYQYNASYICLSLGYLYEDREDSSAAEIWYRRGLKFIESINFSNQKPGIYNIPNVLFDSIKAQIENQLN